MRHNALLGPQGRSTLIDQLGEMVRWINQHVPGGKLQVLRCDFASEAVRQGHGDDIYTAAMAAYCDANPSLRTPKRSTAPRTRGAESMGGRTSTHDGRASAPRGGP